MATDGLSEAYEGRMWDVFCENNDLRMENDELRKLALEMYKAFFSLRIDHCQACPREDACVLTRGSFGGEECAFESDMRDLGIEVDE